MLTFETKSGTGTVENSWQDLSPLQFAEVVALTNQFTSGLIDDLDEYRLRLLELLTGYKRKSRKNKHAEQINENLYLISEQLNFAILPDVGPAEVLEFLSPALRELLTTRFPWEIHEPEYQAQLLQVKHMLEISYKVNYDLGHNPLPFIRNGNELLQGPQFSTAGGDIETNLKAGAFLDASEYFAAWLATKDPKYADMFILRIYEPIDFPEDRDVSLYPQFGESLTRDAATMLFVYIQQTLTADPVFSILFSKSENNQAMGKLNLGPDDAIGQLVEAGYGNHNEVANLDIRTFFNYQVRLIRKNVQQLRDLKKSPAEIAKLLNLSIENVQKL